MRLPDFVIIGAAKSGTTSLYSQLAACPSVFMSNPKEPEFFARDDLYASGIESYAKLFQPTQHDQICGEASTIYSLTSFFPETPARIAAAVPNAKLVYIMRNPVNRCFSMYQEVLKHYQNASRDYEIHRTFEEVMFPDRFPNRAPREKFIASFDAHYSDTPEFLIDGSNYAPQIRAYLEYFDRSAMKFILFEEYNEDKRRHLKELLEFIGADPTDAHGTDRYERKNTSLDHFDKARDLGAIERFKSHYFDPGLVTRALPRPLANSLRKAFLSLSRTIGATPRGPTPMLPETRDELYRLFEAGYNELEQLTGLNLDSWRAEPQNV